ncbi:serine/threonine-protein kinase [Nocardiopsis sp. RSe5-2]|uniref:Serine/threonine-protein kinase n=1 Tax=Nocardiopsis endophytica TaxID=3018445 RepID=A0ABT4U0Q1_9ACTN|nr:serine/threonine-protein kinase [Nocardiopsis endophytica]MDA2810079.1 serine/threonine-protein kinase [Nocardiopsis endophytica]
MSDTTPLTPSRFAPLRREDPRRIGPYTLDGRIGIGGIGAVYAAHQPGMPGHAAVKTVREELAGNAEFRARFARETVLAKRASGMCLPCYYDGDTEAKMPWLATEYIPGPSLRTYVQKRGPLTGDHLTALGVGLADALTRIHAQGVVHQDLKPGNIILGPDAPKLVDFGIARAVDQTVLARSGGAPGTAGWMSPEACAGGELTGRSDVFSWGSLMAFAATGREPFGAGPVDTLADRVMEDEPDIDGVPEPLLPLVRAALSKAPRERPDAVGLVPALVEQWSGRTPATALAGVRAMLTEVWTGMAAPIPAPARSVRRFGRGLAAGVAAVAVLALAGTAAVGAPSALKALAGAGGGEQGGQDASGGENGGADSGEGGDTGNAGAGGGGDEGGDSGRPDGGETPSGPPPEAVERATDQGVGANAAVGSADGTTGLFSADGAATLHANVYGAVSGPEGVRITVNGQSMGVREQVPSFDQSSFYILADGERIEPSQPFTYTPQLEYPMEQEPNENTLVFPGAPETGLLVFQTPEIGGARPGPVGLCYSTGQGARFTTDYTRCT